VQPKYVILLDVGTEPKEKGLSELYWAMECDKNIGGCCGEIIPACPEFFSSL